MDDVLELDLKCNQLTCTALRRILPSLSNCVRLTGLALDVGIDRGLNRRLPAAQKA